MNGFADASISPQWPTRCLLAVLAAMLFASALGMLAMGPTALSLALTNVPTNESLSWRLAAAGVALMAAMIGVWCAGNRNPRDAQTLAWRAFFSVVGVAAAFGVLEQFALNRLTWQMGRAASASACASLTLIFLAERLGPRWITASALRLALLSGPTALLAGWVAQALYGHADERLLLWLECLPLFLLPLGVWGVPSRGLAGAHWIVALCFFCASKLFEVFDGSLQAWWDGHASGHTLARAAVAASIGWLAWMLARQSDPSDGASSTDDRLPELLVIEPRSNARETSAETAA